MSRYTTRAVRRAPILLALAGGLVAAGLFDRSGAAHVAPAVTAESVQPVPVAAPVGAYSSSWFCAGAPTAAAVGTGLVVVANGGRRPVDARVTVVSSPPSSGGRTAGARNVVTVTVAPGAAASVPETVPGGGDWVGAIVDVDGGAVAVSQIVDGPLGRSASPCATSGSQHWYLPAGQSRLNAAETINLLNPYPTDSIVDLSFSTDQGVETPQDFQGLDVPPDGLVAVPLGTHLRRRASIATTVTARTGNVVAWETETVTPPPTGAPLVGTPGAASPLADPASPVPGITVTLGAPSAGTSWVWPDGLAGGGIDEEYVVYNPGPDTASVRLSVGLQQGSAEPFVFTVEPYQAVPVVSEQQARIPAGVAHSATLVSTNGVPVVAARTVAASEAGSGGPNRAGLGQMLGERVTADSWLVPSALTFGGNHQAALIVSNPGTSPVRVTVAGLSTGPAHVSVPGGGRAAITITTQEAAPLVVQADGPVYVEQDVYGTGTTTGYGVTTAVPLS